MASSSTNYNRTATTDFQPQQQPHQAQEYVPNLSSYETGPASNTAGPHQSDFANKLDPSVDSDLNNRARYAPGTTTTTNSHPGATSYVANPQANNTLGPHESDIKNKFDPRVNSKTGEMTTKTTNGNGTGPRKEPVNAGNNNTPTTTSDYTTTGSSNPGHRYSSTFKPTSSTKPSTSGGVVGGSSTGAPAVPSPVSTPTEYSREQGSYNPATGTGYTPTHREQQQAATQPATVPTGATTTGTQTTDTGTTTDAASGSKGIGEGIKGVVAGIHGAGESIRGTFNAAVDRAFNEPEGVAKNEAIGREGEYEARSGQFAPSTKQREGFNRQNRT